jgi:hypothetical protein
MSGDSAVRPSGKRNALLAIAVAGGIAGTWTFYKLAFCLDGAFRW